MEVIRKSPKDAHGNSARLGYAADDYLLAIQVLLEKDAQTEGDLPLFNFMLPTMHQTIELLLKAIAYKIDPDFQPREHSHKTSSIVEKYSAQSSIFESFKQDPARMKLLKVLEESYLAVRYGESGVYYGKNDVNLFFGLVDLLFAELEAKIGFKFR